MAGNDITNFGQFVPTTIIFDVARLQEVDVKSEEFKELLVRLYQTVNSNAIATNIKDTGYYLQQEFVTGALYFNTNNDFNNLRPVYRKTINTGALGPGVTTIAHGLTVTNTWTWTFINGAATNIGTLVGYPIPYAGSGADIQVMVTAANIVITNNSGVVFTNSYIVLEYLKVL